jgi:ubiquinone/menaquinone biosynthesis C-methylase UbiE
MSEPHQTADAQPVNPLASPHPWNLVAEGYQQVTRKYLEQFSRSGLAMLHYGKKTKAIDVACGPGTTSLLLAPCVQSVTCVDFSPNMLDELRRNMAAAGVHNLDVIEADGQALPFDDGSFDTAVSMFGLMFFPDRAKGFAELYRVLAPGGRALVSTWAPVARSPLMRLMMAALQPDDAPQETTQRLFGLEDRAVFTAEMREAGFADITIEEVTHGLMIHDVDQFWNDTVRGVAPITLSKHRASAEEWSAIEHRAIGRIRQTLAGRLPVELASTAYLATARKIAR